MKKFCLDKVMNVTTLKDKVSGLDREIKSRQVMLIKCIYLVATKNSMFRQTSKMERGLNVAIRISRSQHRNKLNTYKQGRDRLFQVATKILTQGREVLS